MKKNLTMVTLVLIAFIWLVGSGLSVRALEQPKGMVQDPPEMPPDIHQLRNPRFLFNGSFIGLQDLPRGNTILVAGATNEKDVVHVFTDKEEFLIWAAQTEHADALIGATREMDERRSSRGKTALKKPEMELQRVSYRSGGGGGIRPLAAPGLLHSGYSYSLNAQFLPLLLYPKLSLFNMNNKVSSAWVVGLTVLSDYNWFGGIRVYLLFIAIPDLGVLDFDNSTSSVFIS